jgi:hypothetical protein
LVRCVVVVADACESSSLCGKEFESLLLSLPESLASSSPLDPYSELV